MDAEQLALAKRIVDGLNLEIEPTAIDPVKPLFGEGLGLDSIDALELVLGVEQELGVQIGNEEVATSALTSIDSLAEFLQAKYPDLTAAVG